jgi:ABC-type Co2+ transport system permease subunit
MSRPSTELGMIVTKLLRCFGSAARPLGMETGKALFNKALFNKALFNKALFKLYHFTLPSPTGSTAHRCEFTACGINDVAAPRMK